MGLVVPLLLGAAGAQRQCGQSWQHRFLSVRGCAGRCSVMFCGMTRDTRAPLGSCGVAAACRSECKNWGWTTLQMGHALTLWSHSRLDATTVVIGLAGPSTRHQCGVCCRTCLRRLWRRAGWMTTMMVEAARRCNALTPAVFFEWRCCNEERVHR